MPSSEDDIYYIDHDAQTNTFSIKVDESSDEIQDFIEGILVIDAQLKVQDLSDKERKMLLRKRKLKIQKLRSAYSAKEAADVLDKKLSEQEKAELEERIIEIQNNLNQGNDEYYYFFNEDTQEFELRLEEDVQLIYDIVAIVLKLTDKIENINTPQTEMLERA